MGRLGRCCSRKSCILNSKSCALDFLSREAAVEHFLCVIRPEPPRVLSGTLPHNVIPASAAYKSLTNHLLFQRSYDWNYNLNRHLKYECGKENAFMCSKCGRRFPHKQNCVYHLKRKHKIVCETIDQYVSAGLVVFQGASVGSNETSPAGGEQQHTNNVNNLKESSVTPPPQLGSSQSGQA